MNSDMIRLGFLDIKNNIKEVIVLCCFMVFISITFIAATNPIIENKTQSLYLKAYDPIPISNNDYSVAYILQNLDSIFSSGGYVYFYSSSLQERYGVYFSILMCKDSDTRSNKVFWLCYKTDINKLVQRSKVVVKHISIDKLLKKYGDYVNLDSIQFDEYVAVEVSGDSFNKISSYKLDDSELNFLIDNTYFDAEDVKNGKDKDFEAILKETPYAVLSEVENTDGENEFIYKFIMPIILSSFVLLALLTFYIQKYLFSQMNTEYKINLIHGGSMLKIYLRANVMLVTLVIINLSVFLALGNFKFDMIFLLALIITALYLVLYEAILAIFLRRGLFIDNI